MERTTGWGAGPAHRVPSTPGTQPSSVKKILVVMSALVMPGMHATASGGHTMATRNSAVSLSCGHRGGQPGLIPGQATEIAGRWEGLAIAMGLECARHGSNGTL